MKKRKLLGLLSELFCSTSFVEASTFNGLKIQISKLS